MFQFLKKATATLLITLLIGVASVMASGKMEVKIGERVDLVGESALLNPQYKWVVKKGKDILGTQSARNFSFQFPTQGEYTVNLTATAGSVVENTTILVLAGERYQRPSVDLPDIVEPGVIPLRLNLQTLPPMDAESQVTLLGDGKVQFLLSDSVGEILEYRIDKNIFEDSDGNGVANDDIDNADHNSYLTGAPWSADYKQGESAKIVAEVTLVNKNGKKAKQQVEIVFREHRTTGDPVAKLEVLPPEDPKDGLVHLYADPHIVSFYSRPSEGKILEYRIDSNIFVDSDGDGDPKNDIDNVDDISFKTGDVFTVEYAKTDEQIIAQLIVVGEGGKGSRVQKGLVFGEKPLPPAPTLEDVDEGGIRLTADKDYVVKGDPITFTVVGLSLGPDQYIFEWDFDGDGEVDKETEGINSVEHIYDFPGVFEAMVAITDAEGNTADRSFLIISKDTEVTKADFSFEVDINTVTFANLSTVATNLADKRLDYQWSFGDTDEAGYEAQKDQIGEKNPVYTYNYAGKYLVTLTITDADQVTDSKSAEVEILQDLGAVPDELITEEPGAPEIEEEGNVFVKFFKIFLYLILIAIVLILLIVGGFLAFFKIQHPDLTFEELVDEFKAKLLEKLGVHEMVPPAEEGIPKPPAPEPTVSEPSAEEPSLESKEPEPSEKEAPEEPVEEPAEVGPTPSWMKEKEVIEGEVEEEPAEPAAPEPSDEETTPPPPETEALPSEPPAEAPPAPEPEAPAEPETPAPEPKKDEGPPPTPPAPPAGGGPATPSGGQAEGPTPEGPTSDEEKGPVPDWLKGV